MPPGFPVPAADVAWLRMERPTNPMTITGVITTATPLSRADLLRLLAERFVPFPRMHARVAGPFGPAPRWTADAAFDLERHVIPLTLPEPGDHTALQTAVSELMSTPLPFDSSPWTFHHVERYGAGSALLIRIHHVVGDGIALVQVVLTLADEFFDAERIARATRRRPRAPLGRRLARMARGALGEAADLLLHPSHLARRAREGGGGARALAALLAMRPDDPTVFKGPATPRKVAAWSGPLDLDTVKRIGRATGSKVNDVLTTAAAGALGRYLRARGEPTAGVEVRAAVPFNVRAPERAFELGNHFGLVFLPLPIGELDPGARLAELKRRMDQIKGSAEPAVVYGILQSIGRAPKWAHRMVVKMFSEKCSAVMTNVPGPTETLHFMGARVDEMMFWVPQAGDIGLGLSILSFDGKLFVGVAADAGRVADPEALVGAFEAEFADLAARFAG